MYRLLCSIVKFPEKTIDKNIQTFGERQTPSSAGDKCDFENTSVHALKSQQIAVFANRHTEVL